jgi:hypothetical protein
MIPAWLLRYVPHVTILTVILVACVYTVHTLREQGRDEMRPIIAELHTALAAEQIIRKQNERAINSYVEELESLRKRPRPSTPVRLCVPAAPETGRPAPAVNDSTSTSGVGTELSGGDLVAGPDIGPALRDLAYGCDAENAKLRALQDWVKGWVQ